MRPSNPSKWKLEAGPCCRDRSGFGKASVLIDSQLLWHSVGDISHFHGRLSPSTERNVMWRGEVLRRGRGLPREMCLFYFFMWTTEASVRPS